MYLDAMDLNDIETTKVKIFISYSSKDKKTVGLLKKNLDGWNFDCFLAHEDIEPLREWIEVIKEHLRNCDVFILFITNNFKESEWTDQETGWAIANNRFIIPLQVDMPPYGFLNHIQGLPIKKSMLESPNYLESEAYISNTCIKINELIEKEPKLKSKNDNFHIYNIIKMLSDSSTFRDANTVAQMLELYNNFTNEHVNLLYRVTKENNQIQGATKASKALKNIFNKNKESLKDEEYHEVMELLSV